MRATLIAVLLLAPLGSHAATFTVTRADDVPRILARIDELRVFDCPLLVGTSRKSFLQALTGRGVEEREFGTAATVAALTLRGVEILRVHAVAAMHDVVRVARAIAEGGN